MPGSDAVTGDRKRQGWHEANEPSPELLRSDPAGVAAAKAIEMLCKVKVQLKIVCAADPAVLYHFCTFSNLLEVKPHPLLLLSCLSPMFSYAAGMKPLFSLLLSSFSIFGSERRQCRYYALILSGNR